MFVCQVIKSFWYTNCNYKHYKWRLYETTCHFLICNKLKTYYRPFIQPTTAHVTISWSYKFVFFIQLSCIKQCPGTAHWRNAPKHAHGDIYCFTLKFSSHSTVKLPKGDLCTDDKGNTDGIQVLRRDASWLTRACRLATPFASCSYILFQTTCILPHS